MEAALGSFRGMNSSHTAIYMLGIRPSLCWMDSGILSVW